MQTIVGIPINSPIYICDTQKCGLIVQTLLINRVKIKNKNLFLIKKKKS